MDPTGETLTLPSGRSKPYAGTPRRQKQIASVALLTQKITYRF